MNGYRPIVELMNANFGIYGMAELSSAGNTYATTGGQFKMPLTVVGAGGTAPNQALGAEHSQPFHAYVMGIPGLKICTAATPEGAYGLCKAMIRDDGPGMLFTPVKLMKDEKVPVDVGTCLPLNKAHLMSKASDASVSSSKAVTVLTYLHGVREAVNAIPEIQAAGHDVDLIELRSLKPLDLETIRESLARTHKLCILDESTNPAASAHPFLRWWARSCSTSSTRPSSACAWTTRPCPTRRRWSRPSSSAGRTW